MENKISAVIVADSVNEFGNRITTFELVYPRWIHSEVLTHRVTSKNSASSRAIPFKKLLHSVQNEPFIPIAWQKDHPGMQGVEYYDNDQKFSLVELKDIMFARLAKMFDSDGDDPEVIDLYMKVMDSFQLYSSYTLPEFWLIIRDEIIKSAVLLAMLGVTKQICNRLLEPFMYIKVVLTSTEFDNFFDLRCPKYTFENEVYKSKKDASENEPYQGIDSKNWFEINKGMGEIHIMDLAEKMWDARNASKPEPLEAGEWHIPYLDKMLTFIHPSDAYDAAVARNDGDFSSRTHLVEASNEIIREVATMMCARTSYTTIDHDDSEWSLERYLKKYAEMVENNHASPFEHCAKVPTRKEYYSNIKGTVNTKQFTNGTNSVIRIEDTPTDDIAGCSVIIMDLFNYVKS